MVRHEACDDDAGAEGHIWCRKHLWEVAVDRDCCMGRIVAAVGRRDSAEAARTGLATYA